MIFYPNRKRRFFNISNRNNRTYTPPEKINVEPGIAMIKDLLDEDLDGHVISFLGETANIARPDTKTRRPVVGTPVISVQIGDHCYHNFFIKVVRYRTSTSTHIT